ncbi:MAG: aminotransferase class IV [Acidobacteriota bacterium]|nr:aminotransferase class IV [Acidobacteriota bacterium]
MHRYVLHNREIRDAHEKLLSPGQVGFLNGWGVFSTMRVSQGALFAFERHLARMRHDAQLMRVPFDFEPDQLNALLLSLVEANEAFDAVLRVVVIRNRGGLFEVPDQDRSFDLIAFTAELTQWGTGVNLTYVPNARLGTSPFAGTKVTSWAQNLTWYEEARQRGFDEAILLNECGEISECTSANIFIIQGKDVWTPPLASSGCLPGVTRAILLEKVRVPGVSIRERVLTPSELESANAVFITSTTRDLLPVFSVDGLSLNQELDTLKLLSEAFAAHRTAYFESVAARQSLVSS